MHRCTNQIFVLSPFNAEHRERERESEGGTRYFYALGFLSFCFDVRLVGELFKMFSHLAARGLHLAWL